MSGSWSTEQLTEFLAAVSSLTSVQDASSAAAERAAEALDAEIGAVVCSGRVTSSLGFADGAADEEALVRAAAGEVDALELDGVGRCRAAAARIESEADAWLVVARSDTDAFAADELNLLRGMARVLAIVLANLRLRDGEREHVAENELLAASLEQQTRLLEQLSRLQGVLSHDVGLQDVFDTIVDGAYDLMGALMASLEILDANDASSMIAVAARGAAGDGSGSFRRAPITEGASGRAIATGELVAIEDYQSAEHTSRLAPAEMQAALSVPVRQHGEVVGSILVGSAEPGKRWSDAEQQLLLVYAEHASLLLAAARTADQMRQAFNDPLTGLANRALFLDRLELQLLRADRFGAPISVLFLDVDRFKLVNDTMGHVAGDTLLIEIARRLRESLRASDTCARLGGDEFAVILGPDEDPERVAERVLAALRPTFDLDGREVSVSASIGIAGGREDPETLLRNADVAMYRAKSLGKGRFARFEQHMHEDLVQRVELEADLRRGLERGEFELHYQPILDLDSGTIVAVEALVRWRHPQRGLVPPLDFIPVAEETGLILPLGRWVLEEACRQVASWQRDVPAAHGLAVTVNLSAQQLQPGLVADVAAALSTHLDPRSLVLEITETVLLEDTEATIETLRELKELGVRIAIDDFGTGYSSLRYLTQFPADILKIAKPFVDALGNRGAAESALAQTIVALGSTLRLDTVAEGIEHASQERRLVGLGCSFGQGFLYSPPVPADELARLLGSPGELLAA
jgi:diguanylate cyclase (GGDEF)-like protein